mgnify:CR=1 FL=1
MPALPAVGRCALDDVRTHGARVAPPSPSVQVVDLKYALSEGGQAARAKLAESRADAKAAKESGEVDEQAAADLSEREQAAAVLVGGPQSDEAPSPCGSSGSSSSSLMSLSDLRLAPSAASVGGLDPLSFLARVCSMDT